MKKLSIYFYERNRFREWIFFFFLILGFTMTAQKEVSGEVKDDTGLLLPAVNVFVEGSDTGTTTDFDGKFNITVPDENTVLKFSSIGFKDKDVQVGSQQVLNVVLEVSNEALEETVVIGYGSRRKQDLTGAVSIISKDDVVAFPSQTVEQTLQGRAAGVQIQSNNGGEPGAPIRIRVRGGTSINASSEPLFVVDGFIAGALPSPEDIASIQILKDASSTAIYGSRGANGVIIVTTKKGTIGKTKVEFNTSYSIQQVSNELDLLNADQYAEYRADSGNPIDQGSVNTDWQDVIFRAGAIQNHQVSISGGGEKTRFYVSGSYFDQEGVVIGSGADRLSVVANINLDINDHIKFGINTLGRRSTRNGVRSQVNSGGRGQAGVISTALRYRPDIGIRDENGDFTIDIDNDNPFVAATEIVNERKRDLFQTNMFTEIELLEGLTFKSTAGFNVRNNRTGEFFPSTTVAGDQVGALGRIDNRKQTDVSLENYFTYKKEINNSKLTATAGHSYNELVRERYGSSGNTFTDTSIGFEGLETAANTFDPISRFSKRKIESFLGRVNYDIDDRFLLTASIRADGASTFSKDKKWGYFPSGAIGWNMHNEAFLEEVDVISQLKWRASYGITGNASEEALGTLAKTESLAVVVNNGVQANGVTVGALGNPNLTWESTEQFNFGIDLGFFNNRINFSADYYTMETTDLINEVLIPSIGGVSGETILVNSGAIENKGFELQLSTKNFVGDFIWNTDFNLSHNKNEVLELPNGNQPFDNSPGHLILNPGAGFLAEGQPVGVFRGNVYDGVAQIGDGSGLNPGTAKYRDLNGDGVLNNDDLTVIGDPNPDFIAGLNNTFQYKGIDLNVFFQASFGNDILSYTLLELNTLQGANNATTLALDRWTPANPNTNVPAAGESDLRVSDRFVFDGSYVRLKNLTLGYTLSDSLTKSLKMTKFRVYLGAQNLWTYTNFPGLDPEASYRGNGSNADSNLNQGLDYGSYPNVKSITMGLNVSF